MNLEDYILTHISPEHPYLYQLYRATNTHLLRPRMASGHLQGQLLKMICQMLNPQKVLEIGTFSGYSALAMASGMSEGSQLHTFEINDEQEAFTRPWIEQSPWAQRITLHIGDIAEQLPTLGIKNFDLAFIDANKRDYCNYYQLLMPYLNTGAWLIADNTLWDGHIIDPHYQHDPQTQGILQFNQLVADEAKKGAIELVLLPIRDGLTIIRKR